MLIPLGTDRPLRRPTLITYILIAANVAIFIGFELLRAVNQDGFLSLRADLWLVGGDRMQWWSLFTYQFMHGGWLHLLMNMLFLWVFGPNLEDRFGRIWFLAFYLGAGVTAGLVHTWMSQSPVVGASGSIAGVTGAFLVLFPLTQVRVLTLFGIITAFWIKAWWFVLFAIALDLFFLAVRGEDTVAREAHLAGYTFGFAVAAALLGTHILEREPYDLWSMARHAHRRRQFKEAGLRQRPLRVAREPERSRQQARREAELDKLNDRIGAKRAAVSQLVARGDLEAAGRAYRALVEEHADKPQAVTLSRDGLYAIGNHYYMTGAHSDAAYAYDRFLESYPKDREAPKVRLLLAIINARHLNDPVRAGALLEDLEPQLDEGERELRRQLLEEIG